MKKRVGKKWFFIALVIIFILAIYFSFFYSVKCKDLGCWEYKIQKCQKATYESDTKNIVWFYKINGKKDNLCNVDVTAKEIKQGLIEAKSFEGKSMECNLPLGVTINPESDPNYCHGLLKEEMQDIIIQKLHKYIVQNVGQINESITKIQ